MGPEPRGVTEWIVLLGTGLERPGRREVLVDLGFGFCCVINYLHDWAGH